MLDKTDHPRMIAVDPKAVRHAWPMVRPFIDRGYEAVDAPIPPDLFNRLCDGRALIWIVSDASHDIIYVFVTELYIRRSGVKVCRLVVGAGERMDEWLPLQKQLEEYARAEGCAKIVAEGRSGWARALDGYTEIRRVIEKDL